MATLLQDLRDGWRSLRATPGLTLAAVLSLGLGIGATTTTFSWVQAVLLRPIPGAADPDRLLIAGLEWRQGQARSWSYPNFRDVRAAATAFDLVAQDDATLSVVVDGQAERAFGGLVSGNYFSTMGVTAALGRLFTPADDVTPGGHPVIVLSHGYWQSRFASDPAILGRELIVNNTPMTVIGVAARPFMGSFLGVSIAAWMPMAMQTAVTGADRLEQRGSGWLQAYLRPKPGVAIGQAEAELQTLVAWLARDYPDDNAGIQAHLLRAWEADFGAPSVMTPILLVLSVVGALVLALACANATNLLLSRAVGRRRDVAVRLSLGASRGRLFRQLLTEAVLLALAAGAAGLAIAYWTSGGLMAFVPPVDAPIDLGVRIDRVTFTFACAISLATGFVFGLVPALQASKPDTVYALKEEAGRGASGGVTGRRLRSTLVVVQIAMCLLLLVSAALFARSLIASQALDPGFDTSHQALASVDLAPSGYTQERGRQFQRAVIERVASLPGVQSAALARLLPLGFSGWSSRTVVVDGYTPAPGEVVHLGYNSVTPRYIETMGIPLLAGREFGPQDTAEGERVIMVNETMARRYWRGSDALNGRVRFTEQWHRVVGVVGDVKSRALNEETEPFMYLPLAQYYTGVVTIQARTAADPAASVAAIRDVVRSLDPNLPVFGTRTFAEHARGVTFPQQMGANLLGVMGAVALLLATIGLYGVISYAVGQRRAEMGIRLALGATPGRLQRMIVAQGATMAGIGVVLGLAAALGAARLVRSLLPGITPWDPLIFALVPLALTLVALAAAWLPARRAGATDPVIALRSE